MRFLREVKQSKSVIQARIAHRSRYIMHIDDDTELPENCIFDESVWNDPRLLATERLVFGSDNHKWVRESEVLFLHHLCDVAFVPRSAL